MKKTLASFLALFLILSVPAVFAQMPLGVPVAPASSPVFERIGIVAAVQGAIELKTPGQVGRIAKSGQPVFMGDEVNTGAEGHLQILLLDETVFTIGPNSAITIDRFVYDPKNREGEIKASVTKGVFRYVSGKIAAKRPNNVTVKLPAATLGFRGTIVGGSIDAGGQGLVGLLGPGNHNDAGAQNGSFTIDGQGGDHQEVNRTGFGVEVNANGGLSGVFQLSNDQINGLTGGLMPQGGGGQGGGEGDGLGGDTDMGDLSGESNVLAGENGESTGEFASLSEGLDDTTSSTAQYSAGQSTKVADGITQFEELATITTGTYHYEATGTYAGTGTMTAKINIDFGSKTIGGGTSSIAVDFSPYNAQASIAAQPFGNSGNAMFHWSNVAATDGIFNNIDVALLNSDGVVANQAKVTADHVGGSIQPGSGAAEGPRSPGPG